MVLRHIRLIVLHSRSVFVDGYHSCISNNADDAGDGHGHYQ
jgi:hypothetical protein